MQKRLFLRAFLALFLCWGCSGEIPDDDVDAGVLAEDFSLRFVTEVVEVVYGDGAGYGQDRFPDVVLGAPVGGGEQQGSTDVLSLGIGGSITLRMGQEIVDGEGADFVVFENAFFYGQDAVFSEGAQVSVSADGENFTAFLCEPENAPPNGCAGFAPVRAKNAQQALSAEGGGDRFDLAEIGVAAAEWVRIVDVGGAGGADGTAGFDLDAVGILQVDSF